jgi:hypothetical protein
MSHNANIQPGTIWQVRFIGPDVDEYVEEAVRVISRHGDDWLVETEAGCEMYIHNQCFQHDATHQYEVLGCPDCQHYCRSCLIDKGFDAPHADRYCQGCGSREVFVYASIKAHMHKQETSKEKPIDCTFRVILLRTRTKGRQFVAVAWNYDEGVFVTSGTSSPTYTGARDKLDAVATRMNLRLRWFDGEYEHTGGGDDTIVPCTFDTVPRSPSAKAG